MYRKSVECMTVYTKKLKIMTDNVPTVIMLGLKKERILQGLKIIETENKETIRPVNGYFVPNVSEKVLRIIISYTNYVNRIVWGKH